MKALVTGGAGFIGSHIVDALLERGDEVIVLDNLSTGKKENLNPKATFVQTDITELAAIQPSFKDVTCVFHCAALPRVQESIQNPIETHNVNITGTLNVFLAAKQAGVQRVVYSASSSAYGQTDQLPLTEGMVPMPISPYGLHKYVGEHYARLFSLLYGMQTVSLRYFNVYGPRLNFTGAYALVIGAFLRQRAAGQPLTITGDGTQTRDFTFVLDVVRANLLAATSPKVGKGEVINIGAGDNQSIQTVAQLISGPNVHIAPRVEPHDTLADIRLAKTLLAWEPQVNFADGLRATIEWFERQPRQ